MDNPNDPNDKTIYCDLCCLGQVALLEASESRD
jgi:hypothetical protein